MYGDEYRDWKGWSGDLFGVVTPVDEAYFNAEVKKFGPLTASPIRVLEIGFGNGAFLAYATKRGWDVVGTELDPGLVSAATARGFSAFTVGDLSRFDSNSFDFVVAFDVLEHIDRTALEQFVTDVGRVLVPGGRFLARFPNGDSPVGMPHQNGDLTHVTAIGRFAVLQLGYAAQLEVVSLSGMAAPLRANSLIRTTHRVITGPLKYLINLTKNVLYFPATPVDFVSVNLVAVFLKPT